MNFDESVKYLYSLGNEVTAMKLGLENPTKLLQALGNPNNNYLKVQVAGTNGKGSTCAFLDSICRNAGIRTGLYTSPHLISIIERVKIDGKEISEKDFAEYATRVREATEKEGLYATFFEQMTAIALLAFAEKEVELAILETGLGGRLDATTAAKSEIVAITPIDYDHQQYLGETLSEIAGEKAAIIREDTKVVLGPQKSEALQVIVEKCKEEKVIPIFEAVNFWTDDFTVVDYKTEKSWYKNIKLSLLGNHQIYNAHTAILLAEVLQDYFKITSKHIEKGLAKASHPGRLEFWNGFLFDGAHNVAGAKALREYLKEFVSQPVTLIFGAMKDKQIKEIAEVLFPAADQLILTKPENPRSALPEELAQFAQQNVYLTENVAEALELSKQFPNNLTCVTGSLYLVGEAQKILEAVLKIP